MADSKKVRERLGDLGEQRLSHQVAISEAVNAGGVGRDVAVTGQLWDGDTLTCEAEAVFTCVDVDRYRVKES